MMRLKIASDMVIDMKNIKNKLGNLLMLTLKTSINNVSKKKTVRDIGMSKEVPIIYFLFKGGKYH